MKPIYGHWSGIATVWCILIAVDTAGGIFDLAARGTLWWLCFWQLILATFAACMLRRELRLLKEGREREREFLARHEAVMAEFVRRLAERYGPTS